MSTNETNTNSGAPGNSRRSFITKSTAAVAGSALVGSLASRSYAAGSDEIRFALIGCGGRGTGAADQALKSTDPDGKAVPIKCVSMADAFGDRLDSSLANLKKAHPDGVTVTEGEKFVGLDAYKKAIAVEGVNAVVTATPPGFRPAIFAESIRQGKHVFMEKPLATDAWGCREILKWGEVAKQKGLKVGVGLQRRHQGQYLETMKRIHDGAIGDITTMRVYWNGAGVWVRDRAAVAEALKHAPSEMEYQVYNWYYFNWLCGDHILEQHIHNIDVGLWAKGELPVYAVGMGGREVRDGIDHGQIFDHFDTQYFFKDGSVMISQARHQPGCWNTVSEYAHGTKGTATLSGATIEPFEGEKWRLRGRFKNPYQQEHDDLWHAVRTNQDYSEVQHAVDATFAAIFGRECNYTGKKMVWSREFANETQLAPGVENYTWDSKPPVMPDAAGRYPVPVPGQAKQA